MTRTEIETMIEKISECREEMLSDLNDLECDIEDADEELTTLKALLDELPAEDE